MKQLLAMLTFKNGKKVHVPTDEEGEMSKESNYLCAASVGWDEGPIRCESMAIVGSDFCERHGSLACTENAYCMDDRYQAAVREIADWIEHGQLKATMSDYGQGHRACQKEVLYALSCMLRGKHPNGEDREVRK